MHKRNQVIDRLKGLGMLFVVSGHSGSPFTGYYYTFHMGLFFFISGFLMMKSNYHSIEFKSFLHHKIIKVIVPFIIFCLISLGVSEWRVYKTNQMLFPIESGHIKSLLFGGGVSGRLLNKLSLMVFSYIVYSLCVHVFSGKVK